MWYQSLLPPHSNDENNMNVGNKKLQIKKILQQKRHEKPPKEVFVNSPEDFISDTSLPVPQFIST